MGVVYHSSLAAITMFFSTRLGAATCICMVGTSTGKFISTFSFFFLAKYILTSRRRRDTLYPPPGPPAAEDRVRLDNAR